MNSVEPEEKNVWAEILRKMLPAGAPLLDEDQLDYSISVDYDGYPLPYKLQRFDPLDFQSYSVRKCSAAVAEMKARSPFIRITNARGSIQSNASPLNSQRLSSASRTQIQEDYGSFDKESQNGNGYHEESTFSLSSNFMQKPRVAPVVNFNTLPPDSETEETCYLSPSPYFAGTGTKLENRREKKRRVCGRCGKGNRLKEREGCLVCDAMYCSNCLLKAMGSMPEGRKCLSCIGKRIKESKRSSLGKCSRNLSRVCSPLEVKQIMKSEKQCAANQLRPEQLIVNGKQLTEEELGEIFGCSLPPHKLKPGMYWYDKDSGLWGKEGRKPDRIITSKLDIGGKLRPDASKGSTKVFINGREITKVELRVLKLANVQCSRNTHFWVYEDGTYEEEGQNNIKGNIWEKFSGGQASTRFISSLLSLPVPRYASCQGSEEVNTTFSRRFMKNEYLEQCAQQLILFGSHGSGTSTVFKQAKFLYGNGFDSTEMQNIKLMIQSNIYRYLSILLEGRERFEEQTLIEKKNDALEAEVSDPDETGVDGSKNCVYSINQRLQQFSDWLLDIIAKGELYAYFPAAAREYAPIIDEIWKDPAIQHTYKRWDELHLPGVTKYFLDRVVEISSNEYEPSKNDILYAGGITQSNGPVNLDFSFEDTSPMFLSHGQNPRCAPRLNKYQLIYVNAKGGCKWLEMLEEIKVVIFCISLTDYDQIRGPSVGGTAQNKMLTSREMFENLVRHSSFRDTQFVLLLNKYDEFETKINRVPLSTCEWFKDFNPLKSQASTAYYYVAMKYKELYMSITGRKLFVWKSRAWEQSSVDEAFKFVREVVKWKEEEKENNMYQVNGDDSFFSMDLSYHSRSK